MKDTIKESLSLYFIAGTQDCTNSPLKEVLEQALQAGITLFQFREKGLGSLENQPKEYRLMAQTCQLLCKQYGVPFIVNDDVKLAQELKADGIHLGQGDAPIKEVIQECGSDYIIGLSTNSVDEYIAAEKINGLDYVGIGPAFTPRSKADHEEVIGLEGIRQVMRTHTLPAVAIGGIDLSNVSEIRQTGVDGIAVVSAIASAPAVREAVERLKMKWSA